MFHLEVRKLADPDGEFEDIKTLEHILEKYIDRKVLLVDDINDTGTTLQAIEDAAYDYALEVGNDVNLKVATLLSKPKQLSKRRLLCKGTNTR